jgi:hypothetical protein
MIQSNIDGFIPSKEYIEHPVFKEIKYMMDLYDHISKTCYSFIPSGTLSIVNYASYIFLALEGTLDSIQTLLKIGRINDAFALVRKLFDDVLVENYIDVIRNDKYDWEENVIVKDVDKWLKGKYRIPQMKKILKVLEKSPRTRDLYPFFGWETYLKKNRELLDDSVHSNRYRFLLLNCNRVHLDNRVKQLQNILILVKQIVRIHLAFIFHMNPQYLMATDYMDYLEAGQQPPDGSDSWIAPYAQEAFDRYIKPYPQIAEFVKKECYLNIE